MKEESANILNEQLMAKQDPVKSVHWMAVAEHVLRYFVMHPNPPEYITQLLMVFTVDEVKHARSPLDKALKIAPDLFRVQSSKL